MKAEGNHSYCSYHGEFIRRRVVNDLPLAEALYAPRLVLPKHSHRHASFCLILQGEYTESYGRVALECKPSSVKFQPAGEDHSDRYGQNRMHCFIVELEARWLTRTGASRLVSDSPCVFNDGATAWLMARLRREFRTADAEASLTIEGLVLELIAGASRRRRLVAEDSRARWLRRAKEFLDESFSQPLTLSVIAEAAGVHPVYLANSFRLHYQCSVGEYLRRRRVEFACGRLSGSKDSLTDIALAAGFSSHAHFSRTFKRVTGMTPVQYKATLGSS